MISLLIRVPLVRRIGGRIHENSRRLRLLGVPTGRARLRLRAGLHLRAGLILPARVEHNRRRLLTWVGRPCLRTRLPLIGRVGRPLLVRWARLVPGCRLPGGRRPG